MPHVLQANADIPDGAEFLLVFDDGDFSEDSTFLVSVHPAQTKVSLTQTPTVDRLDGACTQRRSRQELPDGYVRV